MASSQGHWGTPRMPDNYEEVTGCPCPATFKNVPDRSSQSPRPCQKIKCGFAGMYLEASFQQTTAKHEPADRPAAQGSSAPRHVRLPCELVQPLLLQRNEAHKSKPLATGWAGARERSRPERQWFFPVGQETYVPESKVTAPRA